MVRLQAPEVLTLSEKGCLLAEVHCKLVFDRSGLADIPAYGILATSNQQIGSLNVSEMAVGHEHAW